VGTGCGRGWWSFCESRDSWYGVVGGYRSLLRNSGVYPFLLDHLTASIDPGLWDLVLADELLPLVPARKNKYICVDTSYDLHPTDWTIDYYFEYYFEYSILHKTTTTPAIYCCQLR